MPIAAAAPAIIGAAGSIGSALLGSHKSASTSSALSGLTQQLGLENQGMNMGLNYARPMLGQAGSSIQGATNYYQSLLGGGRQAGMEAAAPEINSILSQYDTAKRSLSQFAPRGGGTNATLAELPFKESGAITNLLAGERSQAAQGLANLGLGEGSLASYLLPKPTSAGSSLLNYGLSEQQQQGQMFGQAGTALGTLFGTLFGGGGGSSNSLAELPINTGTTDYSSLLP